MRTISGPKPFQYGGNVKFHCSDRDTQLGCYLLVGVPLAHRSQHPALLGGEPLQSFAFALGRGPASGANRSVGLVVLDKITCRRQGALEIIKAGSEVHGDLLGWWQRVDGAFKITEPVRYITCGDLGKARFRGLVGAHLRQGFLQCIHCLPSVSDIKRNAVPNDSPVIQSAWASNGPHPPVAATRTLDPNLLIELPQRCCRGFQGIDERCAILGVQPAVIHRWRIHKQLGVKAQRFAYAVTHIAIAVCAIWRAHPLHGVSGDGSAQKTCNIRVRHCLCWLFHISKDIFIRRTCKKNMT